LRAYFGWPRDSAIGRSTFTAARSDRSASIVTGLIQKHAQIGWLSANWLAKAGSAECSLTSA
jgi:hypothetical protein